MGGSYLWGWKKRLLGYEKRSFEVGKSDLLGNEKTTTIKTSIVKAEKIFDVMINHERRAPSECEPPPLRLKKADCRRIRLNRFPKTSEGIPEIKLILHFNLLRKTPHELKKSTNSFF